MTQAFSQTEYHYTLTDLLELENETGERYELIRGFPVQAMAGAKRSHTVIASNLAVRLGNHLNATDSPCYPSISNLKVKISDDTFYYPDVVVDCGDNENFADQPLLIIEILSNSTELKDKGIKLQDYTQLPTLQEYVLIKQNFIEVMVFRKTANWRNPDVYFGGDTVTLESIGLTLPVEDIYHRVKLIFQFK